MTNQSSDTQPALRSLNGSVRAGRLTKFKGQVASIAPGFSVVATVAVLFSGSAAQAACTVTGGVATCDAIKYDFGIVYTEADAVHTLTLPDHPDFTARGEGVEVTYGGGENVSVSMTKGTINATKNELHNHGLSAETTSTGTGNVEARLDVATDGLDINSADNITISSDGSAGLLAKVGYNAIKAATASTPEAMALMTGGKIAIEGGNFTEGVSAFTVSRQGRVVQNSDGTFTVESGGNVTAEMRDGFIHSKAAAGASSAVRAGSHQTDYIGRVTASMSGGEIHNENSGGLGLRATSRSASEHAEAVAHMSGGKITTTGGGNAFAVNATYGGNDNEAAAHNLGAHMVAKISGGTIETFASSTAVRARNTGVGNATAEINQVDGESFITTDGNQAHGLRAASDSRDSESTGVATALIKAGTIEIKGINSVGADSQANGGKGKALTRMEGGSITTHGSYSYGLEAQVDNSDSIGVATVEMTGGTIVTGESGGGNSHGILAHNSGLGDMIVDMSVGNGTITTKGNGSHGIYVEAQAQRRNNFTRYVDGSATQARGIVKLGTFARVTAEGAGSDGIRISGNEVDADDDTTTPNDRVTLGAQGFDIEVAGYVKGGSRAGDAAIRTISSKVGTIDIVSGANVIAGGGGIAIRTETAAAGGDGVPIADDDGTAVIRSAGNIKGNIELAAGDDKLIVTGGSITGDVYGSEGNNTLTLERGRFTGDIRLVGGKNILKIEDGRFTGGIYGGAGDDTVTIFAESTYDGSHVLDGGAGDNDQLTLHGQTISNTAENFRNWERVTLNDTNLRLNELTRLDIDQLSINTGSAFRASGGGGGITIAGDVTNDGSVVLSVQDGAADDVITVEGDYTGSGTSVFALDAVLAGNDANTDRLEIKGDASGEMMLSVTNLDSAGDEDTPLEIDVVSVGGTFNGTFTLVDGNHVMSDGAQAVVSGAHLYTLTEAEDGRGWVLSAMSETGGRNWQPSAPIYDSYGQSLLALNGPASLRSRGSSEDFRSLAWDGGPATQSAGSPLWFRMGTEQVTLAAEHSTTGAALDSSVWELEIGGDVVLSESGAGLLVGGLQFSYATGSTAVTSAFGDGSIDTTGLGLGLAATWYDNRRFYVDGQFTFASYTSDLEADRIGSLADGNGGTGYALSVEAGQQLDLGARLTVIPQAQLSLSSVAFDDFEGERYGEQVTLEDASSQQLRLGLEFGAQEAQETRRLYGIVNLFHEFGAGSEVNVAGTTLTTESEPWAVGVGFGGNYALTDRVDLFGEASYATGLSNAGDTSALSANAGLKMVF